MKARIVRSAFLKLKPGEVLQRNNTQLMAKAGRNGESERKLRPRVFLSHCFLHNWQVKIESSHDTEQFFNAIFTTRRFLLRIENVAAVSSTTHTNYTRGYSYAV